MLNLINLRNYIIAPLTEEWIFRICIILILLDDNKDIKTILYLNPLFFSISHLHHLYENIIIHKYSIKDAIYISLIQFLITSLFAIYNSYLFIKYQSFWICFISHSLCNILGIPNFNFLYNKNIKLIIIYLIGIINFIYLLFNI